MSEVLCKHKLLLLVLFSIQHPNDPVKIGITPHHSSVQLLASPSGGNPKCFPAGAACVGLRTPPDRILSRPRGTCISWHTGTFLPQRLSLSPLPGTCHPQGASQLAPSLQSNIIFSVFKYHVLHEVIPNYPP